MNIDEICKLLDKAKEVGVSHLEMGGLKVDFNSKMKDGNSITIQGTHPPLEETPSDPIRHKVEEMSSLLKLNDQDLVDQLFPDKKEESDS